MVRAIILKEMRKPVGCFLAICSVFWIGLWPSPSLGEDLQITPILSTCVPIGADNPVRIVRGTVLSIGKVSRPKGQICRQEGMVTPHTSVTLMTQSGQKTFWLARNYAVTVVSKYSVLDIVPGSQVLARFVSDNDEPDKALSVWVLPNPFNVNLNDLNRLRSARKTAGTVLRVENGDKGSNIVYQAAGKENRLYFDDSSKFFKTFRTNEANFTKGLRIVVRISKGMCDCSLEIDSFTYTLDGSLIP